MGKINIAQLDQLNSIVQSGDVDVNSGESDKLLRELSVSFDLKPPPGIPGLRTRSPSTWSSTSPTSTTRRRSRRRQRATAERERAAAIRHRPVAAGRRSARRARHVRRAAGVGKVEGGAHPSAAQAYQRASQASGVTALQQCAKLLGQ